MTNALSVGEPKAFDREAWLWLPAVRLIRPVFHPTEQAFFQLVSVRYPTSGQPLLEITCSDLSLR
jgi:hypothetical protein